MSSLKGNFNSEYAAAANRLTNRAKTVIALVEDEYDIPFWNDLLNTNNSGIFFEITPYSSSILHNTAKGKKYLLKLTDNLGPNLIICVDSDYDYLLPTLTNEARIIHTSKYVLQTYVYSIENYNCHASTLNQLCTNAVKQTVKIDFEALLADYSKIIYPLLVWSLLLESKEFGAITSLPRKDAVKFMIVNASIIKIGQETLLKKIDESIFKKTTELEKRFPHYLDEFEVLKKSLERKGLLPENAYLFMRGHDLQHFLIANILEPIRLDYYKRHLHEIDQITTDKVNQKKRFKNIQRPISSFIEVNFEYKYFCSVFKTFLVPALDNLYRDLKKSAV